VCCVSQEGGKGVGEKAGGGEESEGKGDEACNAHATQREGTKKSTEGGARGGESRAGRQPPWTELNGGVGW
jgi:hypothetical protein